MLFLYVSSALANSDERSICRTYLENVYQRTARLTGVWHLKKAFWRWRASFALPLPFSLNASNLGNNYFSERIHHIKPLNLWFITGGWATAYNWATASIPVQEEYGYHMRSPKSENDVIAIRNLWVHFSATMRNARLAPSHAEIRNELNKFKLLFMHNTLVAVFKLSDDFWELPDASGENGYPVVSVEAIYKPRDPVGLVALFRGFDFLRTRLAQTAVAARAQVVLEWIDPIDADFSSQTYVLEEAKKPKGVDASAFKCIGAPRIWRGGTYEVYHQLIRPL